MKLEINRRKWRRGSGDSALLMPKEADEFAGQMCCLGFLARAVGHTRKEIYDYSKPSEIDAPKDFIVDNLLYKNRKDNNLCGKLMQVNDNDKIDDTKRESLLTKLFKKIGVNVVFVR